MKITHWITTFFLSATFVGTLACKMDPKMDNSKMDPKTEPKMDPKMDHSKMGESKK